MNLPLGLLSYFGVGATLDFQFVMLKTTKFNMAANFNQISVFLMSRTRKKTTLVAKNVDFRSFILILDI